MANLFGGNGYRTGIFGKWHLGDCYPYRPMDRGFERAMYHLGWGFTSAPEFDSDYFNGRYRDQGTEKRFSGYCTDFWFNQAEAWMSERQRRGEPFFCYLPTNAPHAPAWVEEKYAAAYRKPGLPAEFFGMIANLDENVGRMESFLRKSGLRENTIVVFMTDNGATLGRNVFNAGMRGHKTTIYEGGHRVPCWVRWPAGRLRPPANVASPSHMQDVLPTLLDLCGVKAPAGARFDGVSLAPQLRAATQAAPDRMFVVQYGQIPKMWEACVIWNNYRLVNGAELFDIREDPAQAKDVASQSPEVVSRMRQYYERWWDGVDRGQAEFQPLSIGAMQENPVLLTCSDWQDTYCDNQRQVSEAAGGPRGGAWKVLVERSGEYEVTLSRWPPWLDQPLNSGRTEQKMTVGKIPAGRAMPVAVACLSVGGSQSSRQTKPDDRSVAFRVRLTAGERLNLQGWFQNEAGQDLCGAFYAAVRRL